ncbi:MAG: methylamine utilization protein [Chitinophagales bacterium]|nr:MAG: methylamine utilization protein [Chitinophagales bacterium]
MSYTYLGSIILLIIGVAGCGKDVPLEVDEPYLLQIPEGFPSPPMPAENQLTQKRVELGRMLFFDKALSADSTLACASCHLPALAFTDGRKVSQGIQQAPGFRNAPTLGNIAYHPYFFRDGGVPTLEQQVLAPIEDPAEMGFSVWGVVDRMMGNPRYVALSQVAYGRQPDAFVLTRALAAFERTLITGNAPFDHFFFKKDTAAISPSALRGFQLFTSPKTSCSVCHAGFDFTDYSFRNIGLYEAYPDTGRKRITGMDSDYGKFKVPSLRNVQLTAPYMHDGSIATLREVILHYNAGGANNPYKDPLIRPLHLTATEVEDLEHFLHALTDLTFIENSSLHP